MTKKPTAAALRTIQRFALQTDAAAHVGLAIPTLRQWTRDKRISTHQWHGQELYYLPEVEQLAANPPRRGRPRKETT